MSVLEKLINKYENQNNKKAESIANKRLVKQTQQLKKIESILEKTREIDNDKVDAIRLLFLYLESEGDDIKYRNLMKFLKK